LLASYCEASSDIESETTGAPRRSKTCLDVVKVDRTPTFFVNGVGLKDAVAFEEVKQKVKSLLKQ
jgi:hypothetical protein